MLCREGGTGSSNSEEDRAHAKGSKVETAQLGGLKQQKATLTVLQSPR